MKKKKSKKIVDWLSLSRAFQKTNGPDSPKSVNPKDPIPNRVTKLKPLLSSQTDKLDST